MLLWVDSGVEEFYWKHLTSLKDLFGLDSHPLFIGKYLMYLTRIPKYEKHDIRDIVWIGDQVEKGRVRESNDYFALSTKLSYIHCMQ